MSATGLLAGSSRSDGLNGTLQDVSQLESLNEVTGTRYKSEVLGKLGIKKGSYEFQIMLLSLMPTLSKLL